MKAFSWTLPLFSCLYAASGLAAQERPNVLFILADDLGYGDLSCYGQERFETPAIDALAREGMRFTQAYSGTTVSAPSRSCLLTGMHSGHTYVRGNIEREPEGQYPLPAEAHTIFHVFKEAGYKTAAFGKWGLGFVGTTGDPQAQGCDTFFGFNCQLLAHSYYPDHLWDNSRRVDLKDNVLEVQYGRGTYAPDLIHQKALEYLDSASPGEPFFLWYPTILPHAELIVPEDSIIRKFRGKYPEKAFQGTEPGHPAFRKGGYCTQLYPHATFASMVTRLDVYVGQLVEKLKEKGLYDNTIIIFASDNGPHREGGADPDFFNSNSIYRGYKRDLYEGGIRIPLIVSWPGHVQAGSETDFMCAFWDMMPTFCDMLSSSIQPSVEALDGISLLPVLTGQKGQKMHDYLYFEFQEQNGKQAVRKGTWKLIYQNIRGNKPYYELYNLAADPSERHNVIDRFPDIAAELKEVMKEAHVESNDFPLL
ncbi:MAG TPA: arylsulfatase [Candidatus Bacteroides merdipullorum]|uniref:Arylsulfatase n=1 Tax=Candidatus Bacteroides merdipullorum TaxID=2838474 RepID=A0A9D2A9B1_9BACE|nr:arylsulfatase [Candidatus Bacteroides merdipullorum]